jgi:hypothetical protein
MADDDKPAWEYPEPHGPADPSPRQQAPPSVRQELTDAVHDVTHPTTTEPRPRVADDLLLLFGRIAALVLFMVVLLTAMLAILRPEKDLSGVYNLLNTQLSLIIGAVLGYAAHPVERD